MEYRKLPHGEEQISILGLGTSSIGAAGEDEIQATVELALEKGINFFDMASADAAPFPAYGRAMAGARDKVCFQIHFGANYQGGMYGWTTDLDTIKRSIDWQLRALKTDYIDFGFLHCLDEESDLQTVLDGGVLDYIQQLQREGTVRHIGMSSHTPQVVNRVLDMGILDLLMFSINPGYDYHHGDYAIGGAEERMALYRRCEAEGVGISVMKALPAAQRQDLSLRAGPHGIPVPPVRPGQARGTHGAAWRPEPGGPHADPGIPGRLPGGAGLLRAGHLRPPGRLRHLRLLQPLPALPRRAGRRPDQQVLRPGPGRRPAGEGPLPQPEPPCGGLHPVRPLRPPLPLPCGADGAHGGDPLLLRPLTAAGRL